MIRIRALSFSCSVVAMILCASVTRAQSPDRAVLEKDIRVLLGELKQTEQQLLSTSQKDKQKYAEFLAQPDTGLIRLLPREIFQERLTISGGGAYYSFRRLTHEYGLGSDIELERGEFRVGFAGADFGFLTSLGKVALEDVTLDHPAAHFLNEFVVPSAAAEVPEQYRRSSAGFEVNGFFYKSAVPIKSKNTYLLRSVGYFRSDLLVALRIVSQDDDGSVVILWKTLKKFPVPMLTQFQSAN